MLLIENNKEIEKHTHKLWIRFQIKFCEFVLKRTVEFLLKKFSATIVQCTCDIKSGDSMLIFVMNVKRSELEEWLAARIDKDYRGCILNPCVFFLL